MKKTTRKKLLSILTAVLLLLLCFAFFAAAQEEIFVPITQTVEDEKTELELDKEYKFSDSLYALFVPQKSGLYQFYYVESDFEISLDGNALEYDERYYGHFVDDVFYPASLSYIELEAGKTYDVYFDRFNSCDDEAIVSVNLYCGHDNKEERAGLDLTCGVNYTPGVYCPDCENWLSGHETSFKSHVDENKDRICEICGKESIDVSGFIGDEKNAEFKLYSNGELVISGSGMIEYFNVNVPGEDLIDLSDKVKFLTIKEGITGFKSLTFANFSYVESITLPAGVTEIEEIDSINGKYLEEFEVSPENKTFSSQDGVLFSKDMKVLYAYPGAKKGKTYTVPDGVERIYDCAFYYCDELEKLKFPASLISVGTNAFGNGVMKNAESEKLITYVDFVAVGTEIEDENASVTLKVREGTKIIASEAFKDTSPRSIILPDGLLTIGAYAFKDIDLSLKGFIIPKTVKYIENDAFDGCFIENLVVPESVEYFGSCGFRDIDSIAFLNPNCEIGNLHSSFAGYYNSYSIDLIVGYDGSTAEKAAFDLDTTFASISEGHEHIYFCTEYYPETCTENGKQVYACPCGKSESKEYIIGAEHSWYFTSMDEDGTIHYACYDCGAETDEKCDCICHKGGIYKFFYKIIRLFWKLFKINDRCECDYSRHY